MFVTSVLLFSGHDLLKTSPELETFKSNLKHSASTINYFVTHEAMSTLNTAALRFHCSHSKLFRPVVSPGSFEQGTGFAKIALALPRIVAS